MPPRMSMMNNMMGVSPTPMGMNMNMNMLSSPMPWSNPQPGMLSPQQFMIPPIPQNADASLLAAHQQAMMYAKQAYQMAVAQQAMAAAEEEWERGSTVAASMINGGGGGGRMSAFGLGSTPMSPMTPMGYGMGMNPMGMNPMGMNMGMQWPGMMGGFPSSAQSMYAGSVLGSELGASAGWGTQSEYGGPSRASRTSAMFASRPTPPMNSARSDYGGPNSANKAPMSRPRKTSSDALSPAAHHRGTKAPPSSWKPTGR